MRQVGIMGRFRPYLRPADSHYYFLPKSWGAAATITGTSPRVEHSNSNGTGHGTNNAHVGDIFPPVLPSAR